MLLKLPISRSKMLNNELALEAAAGRSDECGSLIERIFSWYIRGLQFLSNESIVYILIR